MAVWLIIGTVVVLAAGGAFLYARLRTLSGEIDNLRAYSFRQRDKLSLLEAATLNELKRVRIEIAELKGTLAIRPETPVGEVMTRHIKAMETLAAFKIGGCGNGAFDPRMSLADAAAANDADLVGVLVALNDLIGPTEPRRPADPPGPELKVVTPKENHGQS